MLPPVDPTILSSNPKFEALYHDLCTTKLNPDGTTIPDAKGAKEREGFGVELHTARFEAAKREVVKSALKDLAYRNDELPDELRELVAITVLQLDHRIPPSDRDIVGDYLEEFLQNASPISTPLAKILTTRTTDLTTLISPTAPIPPSSLASHLLSTKTATTLSQSKIATTRLTLATSTSSLLSSHLSLLTSLISTLERQIHGSQARASKAHAEHLSLLAQTMAAKLRVQHLSLLSQLYSTEVAGVLRERSEALRGEERGLKREGGERREVLGRYRGERGMEGLRGEYAEVVGEGERVRGEVVRLEGRA